MRWPGRWEMAVLGVVAVAGTVAALMVSGARLPWSPGGRALPPARARSYENVDACLLTGPRGLADPVAAQEWAGLEDASRATTARVSYLAATGPATAAGTAPFVGSLLVRGCQVIVAAGVPERAAVLADAARYPETRFVVAGPAAGAPNLAALPFTPSGLPAAIASAVESGLRAAGG